MTRIYTEEELFFDSIILRELPPGLEGYTADHAYTRGEAYQAICENGCGTFYLADLKGVTHNEREGSVCFRCPSCNTPQTGCLILVD